VQHQAAIKNDKTRYRFTDGRQITVDQADTPASMLADIQLLIYDAVVDYNGV
jgi:hypothetical protein